MLAHYIKNTFKYLVKFKSYTIINLVGLVVGITAGVIILLYINLELSFDRFHSNADNIYRVYNSSKFNEKEEFYVKTPSPFADFIKDNFPQVQKTVRIAKLEKATIAYNNIQFIEDEIIFADPSINDVFNFPLLRGNSKTALAEPNTIIISEEIARKYFGNTDPIGKTIKVNQSCNLQVSGVLKNIPYNSHIHFNVVISMLTAPSIVGSDFLQNPMNTSVYTYLLLRKNTDSKTLEEALIKIGTKYYGTDMFGSKFYLQPLTSIHLHSNMGGEFESNNTISSIYIFSLIAILVILIACFNFINITTALYSRRLKEIAIRKVFGSQRQKIAIQFIIESFIILAISLCFVCVLTELLTPLISQFIAIPIILSAKLLVSVFLVLFPCILLISIIYPVVFVSGFNPLQIIRNEIIPFQKTGGFRKILVLLQFTITTLLIIASIIIIKQIKYIQHKNLGFDKEALLIIPLTEENIKNKYELIKSKLLQNPAIVSATGMSDIPGAMFWVTSFECEGMQPKENNKTMMFLKSDIDFIKTYKAKIIEGRDFIANDTITGNHGYIINESAAHYLNWQQSAGKKFSSNYGGEGYVVGVVKDFNSKSLHTKIEPLFISINKNNFSYITLKVSTRKTNEIVNFIESTWAKFSDTKPEFFFYVDYYNQLYKSEILFKNIIISFSCLALFISCLGLFGLMLVSTEQKTKEIGIRKLNGASIVQIIKHLYAEYSPILIVAFVLASLIGYYALDKWLQNFAYKTEINWWIFALSGLATFFIALTTISWQAWRAASRNPVEALRSE
jgi:putative ABC transport system permease protein